MQAKSMTKPKKRIHKKEEKRFGFRVSGFGKPILGIRSQASTASVGIV